MVRVTNGFQTAYGVLCGTRENNVTNDVEIRVEPRYLAELSNLLKDQYVFSYHVVIVNHRADTVTLRNRYWEITDAHGEVERVSGQGVVGEQPTLFPGDDFEYSSGANLSTPWGSIRGHYEFEDETGARFEVPVPEFHLRANVVLH